MLSDEEIRSVMEAAGVSRDDYADGVRLSDLVEQAGRLGVIDGELSLWALAGGAEFMVTRDVEGVLVSSEPLDRRMLEWRGFRGDDAVRGVLAVVEREGRALLDRLHARFARTPAPF